MVGFNRTTLFLLDIRLDRSCMCVRVRVRVVVVVVMPLRLR
jgi:hypothetical protein